MAAPALLLLNRELMSRWTPDPQIQVTVPDTVCPKTLPDPGRVVNDALPDPLPLIVMVEPLPKKLSPLVVTPAGITFATRMGAGWLPALPRGRSGPASRKGDDR